MMGLVPLDEEEDRPEFLLSPSLSPPCEKSALCQPGRGLSPKIESASTLTLDYPDSRTVRK